MRNFKKFLALVLAMLMVSACAVSVSAFDDVAAGDKYASAIELLADLEVIKGRGDGKFYPNDTLTREEAAVVAAKLIAGANAPEWVATTTSFVDVEDEWSFAYINYAAKYKAMEGVGNNKFEPKRELQIDEALKIALAVADPNALRQATIDMNTNPTGYWADHFIIAASKVGVEANGREAGLLNGIATIRDYEAPCTRGMFAQIMANAFNFGDGIMEGFGYKAMKATVSVNADNGNVTITNTADADDKITVTGTLFTAALKAEGYDKITAADLANGSYIYVVCLEATKEIASLEVLTTIDVVNYTEGKIKTVKNSDDTLNTTAIEIDGVKYTVNTGDTTSNSGVWGEASTSVSGIKLEVKGVNKTAMAEDTIPTYYEAALYDDNGDGDYERAYITPYVLVTLTEGAEIDHDGKSDTAKVKATVVKQFQLDGTDAKTYTTSKYLTVDGAAYTAWGETPVLAFIKNVDDNNMTAKILETAAKVTGVVSNIKADKYITIDGTQVEFASRYVDPANWTLGQKVSVYTIGGKYVSVASADTGVESGKVEKTILVDNVVVDNGVAMVTGYYHGASFTKDTIKLVGIVDANGKLVARNAYYDDQAKKDWNVNTKEDDTELCAVALGTNKKDDKTIENKIVIADNTFYDVVITSAGAYLVGKFVEVQEPTRATEYVFTASAKTLPAASLVEKPVTISGSYIKQGDAAAYRLADSYVIVKKNVLSTDDMAKAHGFYDETSYEVVTAIPANTKATYGVVDANYAAITKAAEQKVALIYIDTYTATTVAKKVESLAEGMTIVEIVALESAALDYNTYKALDIFTGAEVYVTGNDAVNGSYATVVDGKIVTNATKWVGNFTVKATETLGVIESVIGYNSYLAGEKDGTDATREFYSDDANKVALGLDNVTIWKHKDGKLVADTDFKYVNGDNSVFGYIDNGKVVIITD